MKFFLNGSEHELPNGATIVTLIEDLEYTGQRLAVEVNEEVIPRSEHGETVLQEGDQVEIVRAVGGG
jgi:sulfur carrier protein